MSRLALAGDDLRRGAWTAEEDEKLRAYVAAHGTGHWRSVGRKAGLQRCGKSCRLRWTNYLRPNIRHGSFTPDEEDLIVKLHSSLGSRWSLIAAKMPGRTDNDIKNHWNTRLKKKLFQSSDPASPRQPAAAAADHCDVSAIAHSSLIQNEAAEDLHSWDRSITSTSNCNMAGHADNSACSEEDAAVDLSRSNSRSPSRNHHHADAAISCPTTPAGTFHLPAASASSSKENLMNPLEMGSQSSSCTDNPDIFPNFQIKELLFCNYFFDEPSFLKHIRIHSQHRSHRSVFSLSVTRATMLCTSSQWEKGAMLFDSHTRLGN
ncbi:unnamed protein product [Sphagnum balticum]